MCVQNAVGVQLNELILLMIGGLLIELLILLAFIRFFRASKRNDLPHKGRL